MRKNESETHHSVKERGGRRKKERDEIIQ